MLAKPNEKKKHYNEIKSIVCDIDPEEKQFDKLVNLWVKDLVPYEVLIEHYPSYETSMAKRLLTYALKKVTT
jgi:hypothetical protein